MLNKKTIIHAFNQLANSYSANAMLSTEVGERLLEQLQFMRITPNRVLDLGAGTGNFSQKLAQQYPQAEIISIDIAEQMCLLCHSHEGKNPATICADAELLPIKANTIDLVFANLLLPWCPDIPETLQEIKCILKPGGLLLFTTLGPDTLKEIGQYDFNDMHDIGDLLMQLKFADPVMNMEHLTFTYANVTTLENDLKHWGLAPNQGLPCMIRNMNVAQLTFEIIYGHAWLGDKNIASQNAQGEVVIPINDIKRHRI